MKLLFLKLMPNLQRVIRGLTSWIFAADIALPEIARNTECAMVVCPRLCAQDCGRLGFSAVSQRKPQVKVLEALFPGQEHIVAWAGNAKDWARSAAGSRG